MENPSFFVGPGASVQAVVDALAEVFDVEPEVILLATALDYEWEEAPDFYDGKVLLQWHAYSKGDLVLEIEDFLGENLLQTDSRPDVWLLLAKRLGAAVFVQTTEVGCVRYSPGGAISTVVVEFPEEYGEQKPVVVSGEARSGHRRPRLPADRSGRRFSVLRHTTLRRRGPTGNWMNSGQAPSSVAPVVFPQRAAQGQVNNGKGIGMGEQASNEWTVYCDESGIEARSPCYTIGAMAIRTSSLAAFTNWFSDKQAEYGASDELKWKKIKKRNHRRLNFLLDIFYWVLRSPNCRLRLMVVYKASYNNWKEWGPEKAFYQTYTHLVQAVAKNIEGSHRVVMDEKSDSYARWPEAVQTIGNNMLNQRRGKGQLTEVVQADSKVHFGLQAIDVITGAVNAAHLLGVNPDRQMQEAKKLAIKRMADILGWDGLDHDTLPTLGFGGRPNEVFNVWHWPQECRGPSVDPPARPNRPVFVSPGEV